MLSQKKTVQSSLKLNLVFPARKLSTTFMALEILIVNILMQPPSTNAHFKDPLAFPVVALQTPP